jgi:uncharacterized membrane protein YwaF
MESSSSQSYFSRGARCSGQAQALIGGLYLHLYALVIGVSNLLCDTNFFYLRGKPSEPSLLDYMGPWPVYILVGDLLAGFLFWLLWLPFRKKHSTITPSGAKVGI